MQPSIPCTWCARSPHGESGQRSGSAPRHRTRGWISTIRTDSARFTMARGAGDKPFGTLPTEPERRRRQTEPQSSDTIELQPGVVLGKYRIVRRLGAGGMGTVYEAVHVEIGKRVAL